MGKNNIWRPITLDLVEHLGGLDNIKNYQHCATRFRVEVFEESKINTDGLKKVEKAKGVNQVGTQWQVIFGAGTVEKVYKDFNMYFIENASSDAVSQTSINETQNKKVWWYKDQSFGDNLMMSSKMAIGEFAAVFVPLIPMFIAGGMSLALSSLMNVIGTSSGASFGFYKIFDTVGGAILGMLPVLVAWSAMKRWGGPEAYGIGIGLILVAPSLLNSWDAAVPIAVGLSNGQTMLDYVVAENWATIDEAGNIATILVDGDWLTLSQIDSLLSVAEWNTLGITSSDITANTIVAFNNNWSMEVLHNLYANGNNGVTFESLDAASASLIGTYTIIWSEFAAGIFAISLIGYQAQVFSALLATAITFGFYKLFTRITHESIAIVVIPLATILLSTWLTFWIAGPIGRGISSFIAWFFMFFWTNLNFAWFGLGGFIVCFFWPLLIMTGLHQGLIAVEATLIAQTAATYGESFTFITAGCCAVNVAQGAAIIGYAVVVKNKGEKSMGVSAGITANLGITEPALFGGLIDLVYPLLAAMLGAAVGGYFVGMTATYATTMGSASWIGLVQFNPVATPAYEQFIADNNIHGCLMSWSPMLKGAITMAISFTVAFSLTILFSQTKWGAKRHEAREVDVYSIKNILKKDKLQKEVN